MYTFVSFPDGRVGDAETRHLRVEQVPSPFTELEELITLCSLALGAIPTSAERSSPLRSGPVAQGWAPVLILGTGATPAGTATGIGESASRGGRGWRRGLVSVSVVDDLREEFGATSSNLVLRLFGGLVLPRTPRGRRALLCLGRMTGRRCGGARTVLRVQ